MIYCPSVNIISLTSLLLTVPILYVNLVNIQRANNAWYVRKDLRPRPPQKSRSPCPGNVPLFDGESYKGYRVSIRLVRESLEEYEPARIESPENVYSFMHNLQHSDRERFYSLFLDSKNTVVNCEEISSGSISSTIIHPREVFKSALLCSCNSLLVVHNHPVETQSPH